MIGAGNNVSASDITEVLNMINQARRKFSCADTTLAVTSGATTIQGSQIETLKNSLQEVNSRSGANKDLNPINNFTVGNPVKASIMELLKGRANEVFAHCPCNCNNCSCNCDRCSCDCDNCSCDCDKCSCNCDKCSCNCDKCSCNCDKCPCNCDRCSCVGHTCTCVGKGVNPCSGEW